MDKYSWNDMIADFRALGGIAENIEQRQGRFGSGIFPIDPARPIEIFVPDNLLFDAEEVILNNGAFEISENSKKSKIEKDFFKRYQNSFSWGKDGKKSTERFENGLKDMPQALLDLFRKYGLANIRVRHQGEWDEMIKNKFMQSRKIMYHGRGVLMPVMELMNHSPSSSRFEIAQGIGFKGSFNDEVLVSYSPLTDALIMFFTYGFATDEMNAYSIPLSIQISKDLKVKIGGRPTKLEQVSGLPVPTTTHKEGIIELSHLLIARKFAPRTPRTIFRTALKDVPVAIADEAFDKIRGANIVACTEILETSLQYEGELISELRKAILHQMKAFSYCFGSVVKTAAA